MTCEVIERILKVAVGVFLKIAQDARVELLFVQRWLQIEKSRMCALADSTSGPDTPKCVKSISPRSE